jgi:hypothetical protein
MNVTGCPSAHLLKAVYPGGFVITAFSAGKQSPIKRQKFFDEIRPLNRGLLCSPHYGSVRFSRWMLFERYCLGPSSRPFGLIFLPPIEILLGSIRSGA